MTTLAYMARIACAAGLVVMVSACGDGGEPAASGDGGGGGDAPRAVYGAVQGQPQAAAGSQPQAAKDEPKPASGWGRKADEAASSTGGVKGDKTLSYPEDLQMVMLAYRMRGETPPLEAWGANTTQVRIANEFTRPAALKAEVDRLRDVYDTTDGVGFLRVRTSTQVSQYDGNRGGFYLNAFSPGTTFSFGHYNEKVALQVTNSADAYFWPLDAETAQGVLEKNTNSRVVTVDMLMALGALERRTSGPVMSGRVLEYSVFSSHTGRKDLLFGQVTVP
ncbi:MAG: hypothetical protein WEB93_02890 [Sphingomonadales bacterium]